MGCFVRRFTPVVFLVASAVVTSAGPSGCIVRPGSPPASSANGSDHRLPPTVPAHYWEPGDGRLSDLAEPLHYDLDLEIDPSSPTFSGRAAIQIVVRRPTRHLVLHASALYFTEVSAVIEGETIPGQSFLRHLPPAEAAEVVLSFDRELPAAPMELHLSYNAAFGRSAHGIFRVEEQGRWYAFTHFEPCGAREMFPSFDEPGFKTPFDVAVTVPDGMVAFANMPETSRTRVPAGTRFRFATSPPLPTYLVALAVGDFQVQDGPAAPVPIRLIHTRAAPGDPAGVLERSAQFLQQLTRDLSTPVPFPKVDLVAVPSPYTGAMENPGLITVDASALLIDPRLPDASLWRRRQSLYLAHELAHLWTGDLVTMRWWDDVWLSEGLATFLEGRVIDEVQPTFGARREEAQSIEQVWVDDALSTSRRVREPVVSANDAERVLHDWRPRRKAAAVLTMLERFLGEDALLKGLHDYLHDWAWKSATMADFVASFEHATGRPVRDFLSSFFDQPGAPRLELTETCDRGRLVSVVVRQVPVRLAILSSAPSALRVGEPAAADTRTWTIPFCVTGPGFESVVCRTLTGAITVVPVAAPGARCPTPLDADPAGAGFPERRLDAGDLDLARSEGRSLPVRAKSDLLTNAWRGVLRQELGLDAWLRYAGSLDAETDPDLVAQLAGEFAWISQRWVDDALRPGFDAYASAHAERYRRALGLVMPSQDRAPSSAPGEEDYALLAARGSLTWLLGLVRDPEVLREAYEAGRRWIADSGRDLAGDILQGELLHIAAAHADAPLLEHALAELEHPGAPGDRKSAISVLSELTDPVQVRVALDKLLDVQVNPDELDDMIWVLAWRDATRPVLFDWIASRWTRIREKWPSPWLWPIWGVIAQACDAAALEKLESLFVPPGKTPSDLYGNDPWYASQLERARACRGLRDAAHASLRRFLGEVRDERRP